MAAADGESERVKTETAALAVVDGPATLAAVTVWLPGRAGAVYNPAEVIVPTVEFPALTESTDHVTAVWELPCTAAVNCAVPPTGRLTEDWLSVTLTCGADCVGVDTPPQPPNVRAIAKPRQRPETLN